jgi:hypothetical protein
MAQFHASGKQKAQTATEDAMTISPAVTNARASSSAMIVKYFECEMPEKREAAYRHW